MANGGGDLSGIDRQVRKELGLDGGGGGGKKKKKGGERRSVTRDGIRGEIGPDGRWRANNPGDVPEFHEGTNRQIGQSPGGHKGGKGKKKKDGAGAAREDSPTESAEKLIEKQWRGLISGEISSFGDERAAALKQELIENARGREKRELEAADVDLIRRGIFQSGIAARSARDIRRGTNRDIAQGEREIKLQQIAAEFQDRMAGLEMAQRWLSQKQNYELGKERNKIAREQIAATLSLGYAQIAASKENARISAGAASASLGLQREQFEFSKKLAAANLADRRKMNAINAVSRL